MMKLTVYVPETHLELVKEALFAAGAGEGQFRPLVGSSPFLGKTGEVERVSEYRVEMLCEEKDCVVVTKALRSVHPYEEPAFDFVRLNGVHE